ncbi:hypothetical protein OS493_000146 [Desmophyllum pertusum]|uniref:Uncharacterized protein n=1 Tax=Desmophyllum pertusum TaxID=174260 RepID=A0A9X0A6G8_9CNID|nr:hypothetical protein OS493_000146 [Desmophyllum pertusum]
MVNLSVQSGPISDKSLVRYYYGGDNHFDGDLLSVMKDFSNYNHEHETFYIKKNNLRSGNSHNKPDALLMYEQQLAKLSCPVQYRKEGAFVPSYHEKYPFIY